MQSTLGSSVVATLIAPAELPAYPVGARIEVPVTRAIVAYWRQAAYDPVTGLWTVVLDPPLTVGEYNLVWMDGTFTPPEFEVFIPLSVVRSGVVTTPIIGPYDWAPTVDEVAAAAPAYTTGGFDDDRESAGSQRGSFDEETSPKASAVETLIAAACEEIAGRVAVPIPADQFGLAKATAIQHVKASIAGDKQPSNTDDANGEYRGAVARYLANLTALIENARMPTGSHLH